MIVNLLFLDDLSHFVKECDLHLLIAGFYLPEEDHASFVISTVDSLNESTALENFVKVPLDLKHPPRFLNIDRSLPLLISPLLTLTITGNNTSSAFDSQQRLSYSPTLLQDRRSQ